MDEIISSMKTKTEQALAMGIEIPKDGDWGDKTSRVCGMVGGAIGGNFTKEAVEEFERKLAEREIKWRFPTQNKIPNKRPTFFKVQERNGKLKLEMNTEK